MKRARGWATARPLTDMPREHRVVVIARLSRLGAGDAPGNEPGGIDLWERNATTATPSRQEALGRLAASVLAGISQSIPEGLSMDELGEVSIEGVDGVSLLATEAVLVGGAACAVRDDTMRRLFPRWPVALPIRVRLAGELLLEMAVRPSGGESAGSPVLAS